MPIGTLFSGLVQAKAQAMNANQAALQIAAMRANVNAHLQTSSGQAATQHTINSISGGTFPVNAPTVITPFPPRKDPFVLASEIAASQPKDKAWRLFDGVLFRIQDVVAIQKAPSIDGDLNICVRFNVSKGAVDCEWSHNFLLPIDVPDKTKWFAEHVLGFEFNG